MKLGSRLHTDQEIFCPRAQISFDNLSAIG